MSHKITLEGQTLRFAAAHFTTTGGDCEPLHGHNYEVSVEIAGGLTADGWVMDFGAAKDVCRRICKELDHKFLLQARSERLLVVREDSHVEIRVDGQRYVMPTADVADLEIDNSTAERLAEWFARRLARDLSEMGAPNVISVTVGVEEMPGQAGWFTLDLKP